MTTLEKLNTMRDNGELDCVIEYTDGCEPDDEFIKMMIVNPQNEQHLMYAWVPVDMEEELEAEKELTETWPYHNWTSEWTEFVNRWEDKEEVFYGVDDDEEIRAEFEGYRQEIIEDWNNTELGKKYPISTDNIDLYDSKIVLNNKNII